MTGSDLTACGRTKSLLSSHPKGTGLFRQLTPVPGQNPPPSPSPLFGASRVVFTHAAALDRRRPGRTCLGKDEL